MQKDPFFLLSISDLAVSPTRPEGQKNHFVLSIVPNLGFQLVLRTSPVHISVEDILTVKGKVATGEHTVSQVRRISDWLWTLAI
jgi:hypothetical protein